MQDQVGGGFELCRTWLAAAMEEQGNLCRGRIKEKFHFPAVLAERGAPCIFEKEVQHAVYRLMSEETGLNTNHLV